MIEAINTRDIPGFYLNRSAQAIELMDEVGSDNLSLQYDFYHMQIMEGDLVPTFRRLKDRIGHVQIADNPGRNEPGTGEINYPFIFVGARRGGLRRAGSAANTSPRPPPRPAWAGSSPTARAAA